MPTYDTWERRNPIVALDLETISELLHPAFPGARVVSATPAEGGFGNTVYRVGVAGREQAVALRLCQRDPDASEREVHLWRRIGSTVPMPEVFFGSATGGPGGMAYNASAWVEAEPLDAVLRHLDGEESVPLAEALGAALAAIGAFSFQRAGFFGRDLTIAHPFEGGLVEGFLTHLEQCLFRDTAGRLLGENLSRRLWTYAIDDPTRLDAIRDARQLVHSDFRPANILVRPNPDDCEVAAVIDWDFVHAGSPLADVATLLRHTADRHKSFEAAFMRAFQAHGGELPDDWRHLCSFHDIVTLCDILNGSPDRPTVIRDITSALQRIVDI